MLCVTVLYPKPADSQFDMDYYLNRHTPLVRELLGPVGLVGIDLEAGLAGAAPDTSPTYGMIARLKFNSLDELQTALATNGAALIADIPNFTDVQPVMQISQLV
ncbi:EthD family reductase [Spirosoma montaniterrae]|uniref:Ethyl tert-butyl ether degradation protein EthD n=1 Tax=Spirosoma montaniterrae TaxID=1178516 RepID=A0A1P9WT07_9BACT|nr:EthD family reductase [Spirosoma montaniterrae]AQG78526.1 ethyl tert-butyl ether degradation protein EthD [Spirosoma montaniterrae]